MALDWSLGYLVGHTYALWNVSEGVIPSNFTIGPSEIEDKCGDWIFIELILLLTRQWRILFDGCVCLDAKAQILDTEEASRG